MDKSEKYLPVMEPNDPVEHPSHYCRGGIEVIDVIEAYELGWHLGNVIKYVLRAGHKDSMLEDLRKAQWILNRYIGQQEEL